MKINSPKSRRRFTQPFSNTASSTFASVNTPALVLSVICLSLHIFPASFSLGHQRQLRLHHLSPLNEFSLYLVLFPLRPYLLHNLLLPAHPLSTVLLHCEFGNLRQRVSLLIVIVGLILLQFLSSLLPLY